MRIAYLAVAALALAGARLCAHDYYIDYADGADTREGTSADRAWKHCPGDPAATALAAQVSLAPGDVVHFKGGVAYALTQAPGIVLRWDGAAGNAIRYDGNSKGDWGSGRAVLTDHHGGNSLVGFVAHDGRRHLTIAGFEFTRIGGEPALPPDRGGPVPARFGGGIELRGSVHDIAIEGCVFRELGYWFNAAPMNGAAIAGSAIAVASAEDLRIVDCDFGRVARACDFRGATTLTDVKIKRCEFGDAIMWPVDLPESLRADLKVLKISASRTTGEGWFDRERWRGYGEAPQEAVRIVGSDERVELKASALGSPEPTFQWQKNGVPLEGRTAATLSIPRASLADSGVYTVVATNAAGSSSSNAAVVVVLPQLAFLTGGPWGSDSIVSPVPVPVATSAPLFTSQPVSHALAAGESATLQVAVTGSPAPTLQWWKNSAAVAGATAATLSLAAVTTADSGEYFAVASNIAGQATSAAATVTIFPKGSPIPDSTTPPPVNLGTSVVLGARLLSVEGDGAAVEFTIDGNATQTVVVRAVGPTLEASRLVGAMADPALRVTRDGNEIAANDNWGGGETLRQAMSGVTTFPLADGASADAAVLVALAPGTYRATVTRGSGAGGLVWVDVYAFR